MSDYVRAEYTPLFTQVQDIIAESLNSDPQLSSLGITFYPEHSLEIEYEIKKNLGQQGIVGIVNTLKGFYGGHNGNTNAWEIEAEIDVVENPTIRRAQMKKMGLSAGSTADIIDWVQESLCGPSSPSYGKFCAQQQQLGEDGGLIVGKSIVKTFAIADVSAIVSGEHMWHCPYALASDLEDLSGLVYDMDVKVEWLDAAVKELSAEISGGGGEIWDVVGELSSEVSGLSVQMNNYLPLNITKPTEVSGNTHLDFKCLVRFQQPTVINAALDVPQLNIVNYDVDSYTSLSAIDEDTIGFVGGFNREHTALLNLKNDTIAYTSDMPSKTSELTNDSGFLTSAQVVPSTNIGMTGYAANSDYATRLKALDIATSVPTDRGTIIPTLAYDSTTNTYTLDLYGSVAGYWAWDLHRLFGTDFSPVIRLEWRKGTIWRKRVVGGTVRWSVVYNNNWMWLAKGQYAITCPTGDGKPDGKFYVLNYEDETHPNYINDPATDVHTITYSGQTITSIDGQAGGQQEQAIWCTRTSASPNTIWERPFAYRNELSAKADLSALSQFLPFDKYNSNLDRGFVSYNAQINVSKPYDKPELSAIPTVEVGAGNLGDNRMVIAAHDRSKNGLIVGFNENGLPQIMYGWDDFYLLPDPRTLTYPENGGTIATQEWTEQNCLPLSGDATADVTTNSLASGAVKLGSPNTGGTIGPDAEGVHYQGTLIGDGVVDIQNSAATATVMWRGVKIDGLGTITVKQKNGNDDVVTYDTLNLPRTQTGQQRTIATQEWVLEQLSTLQARIAALENQ